MREMIARRLSAVLGISVYTEFVPQNLDVPSVSVGDGCVTFEGVQDGWTVCLGEFPLVLCEVPPEAVAEALTFVTDRDGQVYRAEALRFDGVFYASFRYRTKLEAECEPAPMMETMTQKTEV